jgi:hypothetical protein
MPRKGIPANLGVAGKQAWREITQHWAISKGQHNMLEALCECRDRMAELSKTLADEGQLQKDRFGVMRIHPASAALKGEVGNYAKLFRSLMLEAPSGNGQERPGRPENYFPEEEE